MITPLPKRSLRVLHLPVNISSHMDVLTAALGEIGVEARGLLINPPHYYQSSTRLHVLPTARNQQPEKGRNIPTLLLQGNEIIKWIAWADIVHWHSSTALRGLDIMWAKLLRKPCIVHFWGSDIRIREIAAFDNPYYEQMGDDHEYVASETAVASYQRQTFFARFGAHCVISCAELLPYIRRDLFPIVRNISPAIECDRYQPIYPEIDKQCPLIVHAPSAPKFKGTPAVLKAVDELRRRGLVFDFKLIHNVPRCQALEMMAQCDIFLDQFVGGAHGAASLEAMAFGKPVVCYIKPSIVSKYPDDLPIVNATQDNLCETLSDLLGDGNQRHNLGKQGRKYVEKHHDSLKVAGELRKIYEEIINPEIRS